MSAFCYLAPETVTGKRETTPPVHRSATGYGKKIPTAWMLQVEGVWRRVYAVCYSNAASHYVMIRGGRYFLGGYDPRS